MRLFPDSNQSDQSNGSGVVFSMLLTILVLLALQAFVFWLLLLLRATIYQQQLFLLAFIFSMMYPMVHVCSMYAVIGPGDLWKRQVAALTSLMAFMGIALLISFCAYRLYFIDNSWSSMITSPIGRGGIFDWIQLPNEVTLLQGLGIFWSAIPGLFVVCQIPYWIWGRFKGKPQLIKQVRRQPRRIAIADLMFLTFVAAVAFAGFSFSLSQSKPDDGQVVGLLKALASNLVYAHLSFMLVCLPMMVMILKRNNRPSIAAMFDQRGAAIVLFLISITTFAASMWAMWNRMAVSYRFVFLIIAPFVTFGFPYFLLILQLKRNGFELSVIQPEE